jgi:hypothetical protein
MQAYWKTLAVTPNDGADLPTKPCMGIMVGVSGIVSYVDAFGTVSNMQCNAGQVYNIALVRIGATGTTATSIRALYGSLETTTI